jgi:type II secretory pathway component PulK
MLNRSSRSRAFILIPVLLAVTLAIGAATALAVFTRNAARYAEEGRSAIVARSAAQALLPLACARLDNDANRSDGPRDEWASPTVHILDDGLTATVTIAPLNDRLPLSQLFLPDGSTMRLELRSAWQNAWQAMGFPDLADPVKDWFDADTDLSAGGLDGPGALNRSPRDLSEVLPCPTVAAMKPEDRIRLIQAMHNFFTVWSDGTVNVNAASQEVLACLDPDLARIATEISDRRKETSLESFSDLESNFAFPSGSTARLKGILKFTSSHFRVTVTLRWKDGHSRSVEAIVVRQGGTSKPIAWREI